MMNKSDILAYLATLGIDRSAANIYLLLLSSDQETPLTLARMSGLNRTTIYRILENLESKGLVRRTLAAKSAAYMATGSEYLRNIVAEKEDELDKLKKNLNPVIGALMRAKKEHPQPTKVNYYSGKSGLRQLLFNTLKAKTDVIGLGWADWNKGIGRKYAEIIRDESVRLKIHHRELLNEDQIDPELSFTGNRDFALNYYQHRIIPRSVLEINHDTYIYNNIFAFYHTYQGEDFGVEIVNNEISASERQIFEIIWKMAVNQPA